VFGNDINIETMETMETMARFMERTPVKRWRFTSDEKEKRARKSV
jgi:hypothetical protein